MAAGGTPANLTFAVGRLYVAPVGTTAPTDSSTALPVAWKVLGYTKAGHKITVRRNVKDVRVAEEVNPVLYRTTSLEGEVEYVLLEMTKSRLAVALGMGVVTDDATAFVPPSQVTEVALVHDTMDTPTAANVRRYMPRCYATDDVILVNESLENPNEIPVKLKLVHDTGIAGVVKIFPGTGGDVGGKTSP